jgi:prolipoprotein diacylglyceryltransferase
MQSTLLQSKFITIYSLWIFACIALIVSVYIAIKLAQKSRLRLQFIADISTPVILGSIIFGRVFAIFENAQYYFYNFSVAKVWQMIAFWQDKEISFWGAILGAIFIFYRKAIQKQENLQKWGDIFMISGVTGLIIGNFGAYLDGTNFGKVTNMFWGVTFDNPIVKYIAPVHPTQIYAMIYCAIIAAILYRIHRQYRNQFDGLILILGLALFSTAKFLEGFFRGDDVIMLWVIRFPELCFLLLAIYSWHKLYLYQKQNNVPFLRKFDYYYGKMLNIISLKRK